MVAVANLDVRAERGLSGMSDMPGKAAAQTPDQVISFARQNNLLTADQSSMLNQADQLRQNGSPELADFVEASVAYSISQANPGVGNTSGLLAQMKGAESKAVEVLLDPAYQMSGGAGITSSLSSRVNVLVDTLASLSQILPPNQQIFSSSELHTLSLATNLAQSGTVDGQLQGMSLKLAVLENSPSLQSSLSPSARNNVDASVSQVKVAQDAYQSVVNGPQGADVTDATSFSKALKTFVSSDTGPVQTAVRTLTQLGVNVSGTALEGLSNGSLSTDPGKARGQFLDFKKTTFEERSSIQQKAGPSLELFSGNDQAISSLNETYSVLGVLDSVSSASTQFNVPGTDPLVKNKDVKAVVDAFVGDLKSASASDFRNLANYMSQQAKNSDSELDANYFKELANWANGCADKASVSLSGTLSGGEAAKAGLDRVTLEATYLNAKATTVGDDTLKQEMQSRADTLTKQVSDILQRLINLLMQTV